ncbi:dipeptidase [Papillibacter cinnamivorans]|uniref:Membrane dipeptidase n=1 Tax=Papillibacter cinnamivorans DSM 12816 TaxID=1122930 RepID=A0A1W1YU49_9FIRM|nr:membrane dipeptidase [Papillibacter cinnamivorans]SMC39669.1 membrane dipeptidase [Papillibacter cinnamivorans DSM 12816]
MKPIPLFDAHCDTIHGCVEEGEDLLRNTGHVDLIRGGAFSPWAQFFAFWILRESVPPGGLYQEFLREYEWFRTELEKNSRCLVLCRSAGEIGKAAAEGRAAALLSVEGAEILDCDIEKLKDAYHKGVRAVNLTWNHCNLLSGSIAEEDTRGLGPEGRTFVQTMEDLGMIVDVSHLSEPGFWDVAAMAKRPFMASHSNARPLAPHPRNLTNAQFRAIVNAGGVAGINLYAGFLGPRPTVDDAVSHIEHFLSQGGEKNVALGCDLDGCEELPAGMRGIQDLNLLYEALLRRNYSQSLVNDIFFNNLMRIVEEVCGI